MGNADNNRKRSTSRKKAQKPSRQADWLLRFSAFLRSKIGLALSVLSIAVLVFANIFLDSRTMVSVPSYAFWFVCLAFGIAALFRSWFKNTVGNGLWILHLFLGVLAGVLFFSFVWLVFLGINYAWRSPQSHVYKAVVVDIYMKRAGRSVQHILLLRFVGNDVTYPLTATGSESQTVMYNPQIQFFPKSETKRPKIALSHKTKRSENRKRTTPKMQPEKVAFLVSTNRLRQALK